ncbi:hypothetical protein [Hirschia maritima]|uniref:hypothetical protein n=1 Tax=Hirschia maritima TaxID=1121961 RepID=UPI00037629CB|nr:hypothetical protein [Hirschia maritima]
MSVSKEELPHNLRGLDVYRRDEMPEEILVFLKDKSFKETDWMTIEIRGHDQKWHKYIPKQKYKPPSVYSLYNEFGNKKSEISFYLHDYQAVDRKLSTIKGDGFKYHSAPTLQLTPVDVNERVLKGKKRQFVSNASIMQGTSTITFCNESVLEIILNYAGNAIEYKPIQFLEADVEPPRGQYYAFECVKKIRAIDLLKNPIVWTYFQEFDVFQAKATISNQEIVFEDKIYGDEHLFYDVVSRMQLMSLALREALAPYGGEEMMFFSNEPVKK